MVIEVNKSTLVIIALIALSVFLGYKLLQPKDNTAHAIEMRYQAERFTRDSLLLVNYLNKEISIRDSALNYSYGQIKMQQTTIKYYEKKIFDAQNAPMHIVDMQLDSILAAIRSKYK